MKCSTSKLSLLVVSMFLCLVLGLSAGQLNAAEVNAGADQVVAMNDVLDPNVVDPNLLMPAHPAWPMAFATNPNSPIGSQPVTVKLNGSYDSNTPVTVAWSVTDAAQAEHIVMDDVTVLDPNVTFDEPNLYSLTLSVDDGVSVVTDTVNIKVKLAGHALQAHWKFDGDKDDPNDYDWYYTSYTGLPGFGPGLVGDAIICTKEDSVSYGKAVGAETSISVAFWMKPAGDFSSDSSQGLVRKYSGTTSDPQGGWTFQLRSVTELRWRCSSGYDNGAGDMIVKDSFPVETWTHVVGTYDGDTGDMKFYLNGKQVGQRNTSQTCFDEFLDEMTIGSSQWAGMIDDLYIFDYPLNSDEIRPLVAKGMNVAPVVRLASDQVKILQPVKDVQLSGTVVEEGAYTVAWTVVDKPDGTIVTFSDAATLPTSVQLESVGNYRLAVTVTDQGTPPQSGSDEIVIKVRPADFDGLEAHITFDDQTANSDLATSVLYSGELFGGPVWDVGISGGEGDSCILLDGVDDHINYDAYLGSDPCCTISLWIGNDAVDVASHIIQKWATDGSGKGWLIRNRPTDNPGEVSPMIGSSFSSGSNWNNSGGYLPPFTWTHLAMTFDGSVCSLYMNGVQFFSETVNPAYSPDDLVTPMVIGYRWNNDSTFFMGAIDEVRIYDRALTAEAMLALYHKEKGD